MTLARPPIPLPDPALRAGGLLLRPWTSADAAVLAAAWADPEVARWTGVPEVADDAAARRWISGEADRRARGLALDVVIDLDGVAAGEVGLAHLDPGAGTVEIGWWVAAPHRGRGLAAQAARLLAPWAVQELAIDRVLARCHRDNPASVAVARAAGFRPAAASGPVEVWELT